MTSSEDFTLQHRRLFVNMNRRLINRVEHGSRKNDSFRNTFIVFIALVVIYYIVDGYDGDLSVIDGEQFTFTITHNAIWAIIIWISVTLIVLSIFRNTKIALLLQWILVRWPLLFAFLRVMFNTGEPVQKTVWVWLSFTIIQGLTILGFIIYDYGYPRMVKSEFFCEKANIRSFFGIHVVSDWTMTYSGAFGCLRRCLTKRKTCKYEGDLNEEGVPDGFGFWFDDNYHGELLSGYWQNGKPVAPFLSRQYGTGDAIRAVRIAYFLARDDGFSSALFFPKNEDDARCGVASVECSIQGSFFKHLPEANVLIEPKVVVDDQNCSTVGECLRQLIRIETREHNGASNFVGVSCADLRGLQVVGHVHQATGRAFSTAAETEQIVINVRKDKNEKLSMIRQPSRYMPLASDRATGPEVELIPMANESEPPETALEQESSGANVWLEVQNWIPNRMKAALIYFPGFNSHTKKSLNTLGQFMAMTELTAHVYPILYSWPAGTALTYRHASHAANTLRNREHFQKLLRGLSSAGVRHVHLMSHSMGAQSLLSFFQDKDDGSRSDASQCFALSSDFSTTESEADDEKLMILKSVTLLNPDFPLKAFVNHAYLTIRRLCSHITVVGDSDDGALFMSQAINGLCDFMGYKQAKVLNPDGKESKKTSRLHYQLRVGRHFHLLHHPDPAEQASDEENTGKEIDKRLVFRDKPPAVLSMEGAEKNKIWLDVDVIDTTNLDTNIEGLRHSAFNVNPILLNDLEELITEGRRAKQRASLLYREGNTFSYCHAPSFVAM